MGALLTIGHQFVWAGRRTRQTARIARIGVESSERLGRLRWVVERTIS